MCSAELTATAGASTRLISIYRFTHRVLTHKCTTSLDRYKGSGLCPTDWALEIRKSKCSKQEGHGARHRSFPTQHMLVEHQSWAPGFMLQVQMQIDAAPPWRTSHFNAGDGLRNSHDAKQKEEHDLKHRAWHGTTKEGMRTRETGSKCFWVLFVILSGSMKAPRRQHVFLLLYTTPYLETELHSKKVLK